VPRIYQVTPGIPDRRRATKQEQVRPQIWPTASKRVSSPPVGTIPSASDVTDEPNHNSKPQSGSVAGAVDHAGPANERHPDRQGQAVREAG
jgi:hypothetical protein